MFTLKHPQRHAVGVLLAVLVMGAFASAAPPPLPPITSVPSNPRLPGKFVWADLVTDNVPAASKFYSGMFGWTFRDYGGYLIAANDDRPLCGLFQRSRPQGQPDAKPRWIGYISVSSVERAQKAVTTAGGRVLAAPGKYPKRGEQAVFADLEGVPFGVVKSSTGDPEDFLAESGDWIWIQLLSRDARKAAEFYRGVAGYEIIENRANTRLSDFVLTSKGYARATVRTIAQAQEKMRPAWLPFVRVKNVSESVTLAKQLGGKVLIEPKPQYLEGKVAVVADPTGAAIGVLEWSEGLLKGGQ